MDTMSHYLTHKEAKQQAKTNAAGRALALLVDGMVRDANYPEITDELHAYQLIYAGLTGPNAERWWTVLGDVHAIDDDRDTTVTYDTTRPMILVNMRARIDTLTLAAEMAKTGADAIDRLFAGLV